MREFSGHINRFKDNFRFNVTYSGDGRIQFSIQKLNGLLTLHRRIGRPFSRPCGTYGSNLNHTRIHEHDLEKKGILVVKNNQKKCSSKYNNYVQNAVLKF